MSREHKNGKEKRRWIMSEEDLELLITLDDPVEALEEDTFDHLHPEKTRDERAEESGGAQ
jgi:hypothetical protein